MSRRLSDPRRRGITRGVVIDALKHFTTDVQPYVRRSDIARFVRSHIPLEKVPENEGPILASAVSTHLGRWDKQGLIRRRLLAGQHAVEVLSRDWTRYATKAGPEFQPGLAALRRAH